MWILIYGNQIFHLFANEKYTVGREVLTDKSISRQHAEFSVSELNEKQVVDKNYKTSLFLIDKSKFGSFVNGNKAEKDKKTELKVGDKVKIGSDSQEFTIQWKNFNVLFSRVPQTEKKEFLSKFLKIDGRVLFQDDYEAFTHLICKEDGSLPTEKVIISMLQLKPIISASFIEALLNRKDLSFPSEDKFLPNVNLSEWNVPSVIVNTKRKDIFDNKKFVFLSKESFDKNKKIIQYGSGKSIEASTEEINLEFVKKYEKDLIIIDHKSLEQKLKLEKFNFSPILDTDILGLVVSTDYSKYCHPKSYPNLSELDKKKDDEKKKKEEELKKKKEENERKERLEQEKKEKEEKERKEKEEMEKKEKLKKEEKEKKEREEREKKEKQEKEKKEKEEKLKEEKRQKEEKEKKEREEREKKEKEKEKEISKIKVKEEEETKKPSFQKNLKRKNESSEETPKKQKVSQETESPNENTPVKEESKSTESTPRSKESTPRATPTKESPSLISIEFIDLTDKSPVSSKSFKKSKFIKGDAIIQLEEMVASSSFEGKPAPITPSKSLEKEEDDELFNSNTDKKKKKK